MSQGRNFLVEKVEILKKVLDFCLAVCYIRHNCNNREINSNYGCIFTHIPGNRINVRFIPLRWIHDEEGTF